MEFKIPTAFEWKRNQLSESKDTNHSQQKIDTPTPLADSVPTAFDSLTRLEEHAEKLSRAKELREWEQELRYLCRMVKWIQEKIELTGFSRPICNAMWFESALEREQNQQVRVRIRKHLAMSYRLNAPLRINDELYARGAPRTREPYVGKRYGKLTGIHALNHDRFGALVIKLRCDCGRERAARLSDVKRGNIVSCGNCEGDSIVPRSHLTLAAVFKDSLNNHLSAAKVTNHSQPIQPTHQPAKPNGDSND